METVWGGGWTEEDGRSVGGRGFGYIYGYIP